MGGCLTDSPSGSGVCNTQPQSMPADLIHSIADHQNTHTCQGYRLTLDAGVRKESTGLSYSPTSHPPHCSDDSESQTVILPSPNHLQTVAAGLPPSDSEVHI
ncbi:hypothetical protein AMECASPLE_002000 [Ameca splendens]|uniref:Uncharacterized protein n=1 Tax=Ameca splendens TaxID=208324 RepID=A0ABV0YL80_9TELE